MRLEEFNNNPVDEDSAIESVLGENPRARELHSMIEAVQQRRSAVLREADKSTSASERFKLEARLADLDMQLKVLRDEEAITKFVEDSVRVTISRPGLNYLDDEEYPED